MKVYTIFTGILSVFILSGCTASSFNEMVNDKRYEQKAYVISENYQVLYKRALDKSRECHEMGMLTSSVVAEGQIFTEIKQAELSVHQINVGRSIYFGAKFEALDNNRTTMTIYSRYGGNDRLKKEFTGECKSCNCSAENEK